MIRLTQVIRQLKIHKHMHSTWPLPATDLNSNLGINHKQNPNTSNETVLENLISPLPNLLQFSTGNFPSTQNNQFIDNYPPKIIMENINNTSISNSHHRRQQHQHNTSLFMTELEKRQIKLEEEMINDAVKGYTEALQNLLKLGRGSGLKFVQKILLAWYDPLVAAIQEEIKFIEREIPGYDRVMYGPYLLALNVEKLAIITLNTTVNSILKCGNAGAQVTNLSIEIGNLIQTEINIAKLSEQKENSFVKKLLSEVTNQKNSKYSRLLARKVRKILEEDEWEPARKVKVGCALLTLLIKSAKLENSDVSAFQHSTEYSFKSLKRLGVIYLEKKAFKSISEKDHESVLPRYLPMLTPPLPWDVLKKKGGYYKLQPTLMRVHSKSQTEAVKRADLQQIITGLNYLGSMPWRINERVYNVILEACEKGETIGEIPPKVDFPLPAKEEAMIALKEPTQYSGKFKDNASEDRYNLYVKQYKEWDQQPKFNEKFYNDLLRRVNGKNSDLHSLRCDLQLKLWVARTFLKDTIYFPVNVDFRGRAYPIPPNLNHLGSDLCRGMLKFETSKKLGPVGHRWIKIHLCNLFGNNKMSFDEREAWTNKHIEEVYDSAIQPLQGKRFWAKAEEPFQALATCFELYNISKCNDPQEYLSNLPVHQDGSCNGLQHYAALGKDELGGKAVNLSPSSTPQDVYSKVLEIVLRDLESDCLLSEHSTDERLNRKGKCARLLKGNVTRKVIKQTVMTSVYGVTSRGAKEQIYARLVERLIDDKASALTNPELEADINYAATYLASCTLNAIAEMFSGAKAIMDWLGNCATLVASEDQTMSWITPLGLPVIQPYRTSSKKMVRTALQLVILAHESDDLPVSSRKQRTAFPPNFVHSLDATHMLLTTLKMKEMNLTFATVHDSYWTHAADIDTMNKALRDSFVDLYEQPILQNLRESLLKRYPDVVFPPVPQRGTLDITLVRDSPYFFH